MKLRVAFAGLLLALSALSSAQAKTHRIGSWWWYSEDAYTEPTCTRYLDELQKACVTEIYFCGAESLESEERAKLHDFVQKAMAHGMRVAILYDKWKDFMDDGGKRFVGRIIPRFLDYRKKYPKDDLYGIHLDIEKPSTVPAYTTQVLQDYCNGMVEKVQIARKAGISCEVDVPCGWNCQGGLDVTFRGVKGVYNILAQYMDTVTFMSYRDEAQQIFDFANLAALPAAVANGCDFLVGVETADSGEGDFVDFHNEDKAYLFKQLDKVFKILDNRKCSVSYGVAIHHVRSFIALPGEIPNGNGRNQPAVKGSRRGTRPVTPPRKPAVTKQKKKRK